MGLIFLVNRYKLCSVYVGLAAQFGEIVIFCDLSNKATFGLHVKATQIRPQKPKLLIRDSDLISYESLKSTNDMISIFYFSNKTYASFLRGPAEMLLTHKKGGGQATKV